MRHVAADADGVGLKGAGATQDHATGRQVGADADGIGLTDGTEVSVPNNDIATFGSGIVGARPLADGCISVAPR